MTAHGAIFASWRVGVYHAPTLLLPTTLHFAAFAVLLMPGSQGSPTHGARIQIEHLPGSATTEGPRLELVRGANREPVELRFRNVPDGTATLIYVSVRRTDLRLGFARGRLRADPAVPGATAIPVPGGMPLHEMSGTLENRPLVLQGVVVGPAGIVLCDAFEFRVLAPTTTQRVAGRRRFPRFEPTGHVATIAHKASGVGAPENTLAGIDAAFRAGSTHVEVDIRISKDGHPVLMHDWTVDRTTNGRGFVAQHTLAELSKLDAGAGEPVPTLTAAIAAAAGRGRLLLDVKESHAPAAIARAIKQIASPGDKIWIYVHTSRAALRTYQDTLPNVPKVFGSVPRAYDAASLEELAAFGVVGFDIQWGEIPAAFVQAAHKVGLFVFAYTINDPEQMRGAIQLGIDGMETDRLAVLRALLDDDGKGPRTGLWIGLGIILGVTTLVIVVTRRRD